MYLSGDSRQTLANGDMGVTVLQAYLSSDSWQTLAKAAWSRRTPSVPALTGTDRDETPASLGLVMYRTVRGFVRDKFRPALHVKAVRPLTLDAKETHQLVEVAPLGLPDVSYHAKDVGGLL